MNTLTKQVALDTFEIDSAHSRLGFIVRHLGFSKVRGSFEAFEGTVRIDGNDLATLEAEATIETASISTNEEKRDAHLRSEDFFDAENHPTLTFRSTEIGDVDGNSFKMKGHLTMRGVTKEVELLGEFLGEGPDPWGGTRIGLEARTLINRKDFGLNWNVALEAGGFLVGEDVEIVLEIQAVKASSSSDQ